MMAKDTTPKDSYAENAKQDKLNRDEREGYEKELARQKIENEAPRKAVGEAVDKAVDYVKGKAKDIADSDFAKGMRNYGRLYKEGLGMKPDTAYEKKKGGVVKSASARADGCAIRGKTRA
jgi:hypothetical protein